MQFSFSDMFWQFLSNWKKALILAVAVGLVFGGFQLAKGITQINDPEYLDAIRQKNTIAQESYDVQVKAYENQIANLQLQIEKKEESRQNAIMLRIDPYNTYVKYVAFYIDTNYQIMPEMTYQNPNRTNTVTNSYIDALRNMNLDDAIATPEEPDLTAQNPFTNADYSLLTVSDESGGGLIYITIKGDTKDRVETIFAAVKELMEERRQMLKATASEHTLTILSEVDDIVTDVSARYLQNHFVENYSELVTNLKLAQETMESLEEPKTIGTGIKSVIVSAVKNGFVGGVVGAVLAFGIWGVIRCLRGKVNSVEELRRKYDGIMLAAIPKVSVKRSELDRKILRHLGIRKKLDYDSGVELAAANIRLYLPEDNDLLLIGTVDEGKLSKLCKDLTELLPEKKIIVGGDVNISAAAVNAVKEGHTVICVEELNESSYRYINHELEAMDKAREQENYFIVIG